MKGGCNRRIFLHTQHRRASAVSSRPGGLGYEPVAGDALVSCVKRAVPEREKNWYRQTTHSTVNEVVAVVPPPAGSASTGGATLLRTYSFQMLNELASPRALSRITTTVRALPPPLRDNPSICLAVGRFPASSVLFPVVSPSLPGCHTVSPRWWIAVVHTDTGLHIPVVLRAHGSRDSQAADAACAIQRLRILPFTTGSALLQLQTSPHDRWKMECAFMLCACFYPHQARWILVIPQQQGFG